MYMSGLGSPGFSVSTDSVSVNITPETNTNKIRNSNTNRSRLYTDYYIDNWIDTLLSFEYDVISYFRNDNNENHINVSAVNNNINKYWNVTWRK